MALGCQNSILRNDNKQLQRPTNRDDLHDLDSHTNGFVPLKKLDGHIRFMYCNSNEFNINKTLKVSKLFKYFVNNKVDVAAIAEIETKWSSREVFKLEREV